jgi:hypothetical protein
MAAPKTEVEVESSQNALSSGLMHVLQPSIAALDSKVNNVR